MKTDLISTIELIATVSYAVSGSLAGVRKNMDYFGVTFLGVITSVGGGAIRDLIIGRNPPMLFVNPIFVIVSFSVSTITFVILYFHVGADVFKKETKAFEIIYFIFDTVGLAAFTMDGTIVGQTVVENPLVFLTVVLGLTTGIGGGIIRDLLIQEVSAVFVKHIYAIASIAGALVTALLWNLLGRTASVFIGFTVIVAVRCLAAKYKWNMPRVH